MNELDKAMVTVGVISSIFFGTLGAGALFVVCVSCIKDYYDKAKGRRNKLKLEDSDNANTRRDLIKYRNKIDLRLSKMGE